MYGEEITPNEHKLARQFGVLDNFYDSGEVSGDGHVWSNAAISSDYTEKTWQQSYRGKERVYDYEGEVENGYPLLEGISDINEPSSGYLWTNLARNGKSLYHFGEFISTKFCADPESGAQGISPPRERRNRRPRSAERRGYPPRRSDSAELRRRNQPLPWPIPLINKNVATKPELVGHFDPITRTSISAFPISCGWKSFSPTSASGCRIAGRGRIRCRSSSASPPQRPHRWNHTGDADTQGFGRR